MSLERGKLNPVAVALLSADAICYINRHGTKIEGDSLPKHGPFIVTGNHFNEYDARKGHYFGLMSHRMIRIIVKQSLLKKGAVESDDYLISLNETKEGAIKEYSPIKSWVLNRIGTIGILRDHPGLGFRREIQSDIKQGHGVGIFLQDHRQKDCLLENLQPGVAYFARVNPDVAIYTLASAGPPVDEVDRATLLKLGTYNELKAGYGKDLTISELTLIIADLIATSLPEKPLVDWATRWSFELDRLNNLTKKSSKK